MGSLLYRTLAAAKEGDVTIEEEVRAFVSVHIPRGERYLADVPVPAFKGRTWEQMWAAGDVPDRIQRKVLQQLRNGHGKRSSF